MGLESQLAAVRSLIESDPDAVGLIDRCDLVDKVLVDGGSGGDSVSPSTLASNQPCLVEELEARDQVTLTVGGETFTVTHRIFMLWSTGSKALTEKGYIKVLARDPYPIMYFEKPTRTGETLASLAEFKAVRVKQGYA